MERFRKFHGESRCWVVFENGASFEHVVVFFSVKIRESCVRHRDVYQSRKFNQVFNDTLVSIFSIMYPPYHWKGLC